MYVLSVVLLCFIRQRTQRFRVVLKKTNHIKFHVCLESHSFSMLQKGVLQNKKYSKNAVEQRFSAFDSSSSRKDYSWSAPFQDCSFS